MNFTTTKKAAMFGLDARIALAIFGALSVISGAALYSAIEEAKVEQWRQNFDNVTKAYQSYYLDTGEQLQLYSNEGFEYLGDIITNRKSLKRWNGPYLNNGTGSGTTIQISGVTSQITSDSFIFMRAQQSSSWDNSNGNLCVSVSDCTEWVSLKAGNSKNVNEIISLFNKMDQKLDNGDGKLNGRIRLIEEDINNTYLMYNSNIPRKKWTI